MDLQVLVPSQLAPLLWACGKAEYHGVRNRSLSLCGVLFIPSKHHVSSVCLASAGLLPQHRFPLSTRIHPTSLRPRKRLEAAAHHQNSRTVVWFGLVFCEVSLYGVLTNAAQLCSARLTNTCVSLAKNPSSHVLSCFIRKSSVLCLLQLKVPS